MTVATVGCSRLHEKENARAQDDDTEEHEDPEYGPFCTHGCNDATKNVIELTLAEVGSLLHVDVRDIHAILSVIGLNLEERVVKHIEGGLPGKVGANSDAGARLDLPHGVVVSCVTSNGVTVCANNDGLGNAQYIWVNLVEVALR